MSWLQALGLVGSVSCIVVLTAAMLVTRTDPKAFPDFGTGLWWDVTTVTTVGYGDVVPMSSAGRLVGAVLMFVGIGSIAFLTAVAASAIVVGEVAEEEQEIEREEREIERVQDAIFARLGEIDARLARMEGAVPASALGSPLVSGGSLSPKANPCSGTTRPSPVEDSRTGGAADPAQDW